MLTPQQQLDVFIEKYTPAIAARGRLVIARVRGMTPGAVELVYDNYNALVIGFGPNDRTSEAILSIAFYPKWVTLFFLQAARTKMPDPYKLLRGSGSVARHVVLERDADIDDPAVVGLIEEALRTAEAPLDPTRARTLIIRSVSTKQRPRRPRETFSV